MSHATGPSFRFFLRARALWERVCAGARPFARGGGGGVRETTGWLLELVSIVFKRLLILRSSVIKASPARSRADLSGVRVAEKKTTFDPLRPLRSYPSLSERASSFISLSLIYTQFDSTDRRPSQAEQVERKHDDACVLAAAAGGGSGGGGWRQVAAGQRHRCAPKDSNSHTQHDTRHIKQTHRRAGRGS